MGPKKKEAGAGETEILGEDPVLLLQNYQKFCKYVVVILMCRNCWIYYLNIYIVIYISYFIFQILFIYIYDI